MPIYEYACSECGHEFEKLVPMNAPPPEACPSCGKAGTVTKKISRSAVKFVGQGWYVTDYSGKTPREAPPSSAESSSGSSSDSSKEKKAGTKPEAKSGSSKDSAKPKKAAEK